MHPSCRRWAELRVDQLGIQYRHVLEVGSLDVNGGVRDLFTGPYIGTDMREGPGVTMVMDAESLKFDDDEFEVVISTEMLEHCRRPWLAVAEMARVCAPGGYVLVSARGFDERGAFDLHDHPGDHWRFGPGSLDMLAADAGLDVLECIPDPDCPGWFLTAAKR